ncbi:MAG: cell division protein ZapB [Syntrophales bacterium]|nr:cell division protein ZapB [Syntrophales bacterium]
MELGKFEELEGKIKDLVFKYSLLKRRNNELEDLLKNKELELGKASTNVGKLNEERDTVRTKVDSLLDLLQDIDVSS